MTAANGKHVAIIGGGYAGMAAAVSLAELGVRCTVFDAGKELGGRARRVDYRGEVLDNGQHILSGAYSSLLRLMTLIGAPDSATVRVPLRLEFPPVFSLRAPRWPAPLHLAWALLTAHGLSLADRLAAIRFMRALKTVKFNVGTENTVAALLAAHTQPDSLIRYLWSPLAIAALNTPIGTASAQVFVHVLRDALGSTRLASDIVLPRIDLSALFPDVAASWISSHGGEIRRGERVTKVLLTGNAFRLETDAVQAEFDAIIVAIGPHQFDAISMPTGISKADFRYEPIVTVYLKFDQPVRLPFPMLGQAEGMVQWFFDRRQIGACKADRGHGDSADGEDGLIAAVISASGPHDALPLDELAAIALRELARHTGPLPSLVWHKVITEKFATFACTPVAQRARPVNRTALPGLFLAGDYTAGDYPATLEGAVRSGIAAAGLASDFVSQPGAA